VKLRKSVSVFTLTLVGCLALAVLPGISTAGAATKSPIQVAAILEQTGLYSAEGAAAKQGLAIEVKLINQQGGILGRQVKVTYFDDQSTLTVAGSQAQQVFDSGKYSVLIAGSDELPAMVSSFNSKVLEMSPGLLPTMSLKTYPTFFAAVPSLYPSPAAIGSYIVNSLHAKSVGIIYGQDSAGVPDLDAYEAAFKGAGVTVTSEAASDTAVDVTSELNVLQNAHPDVLIDSTYGPLTGHVAQGLHDIGWNVPVVGDLLAAASNVGGLVPSASYIKNWKVIYFSSLVRHGKNAPSQVAQFGNAIQSTYGKITGSINSYTEPGDLMLLAKYAFDKIGSTNALKAAHALENITKDPAASKIKFLTTSKYGYSPTSPYSFSVSAEEQGATNAYFDMANPAAPQVDGTLLYAASIPNGPVKIKSPGQ
jgi:ABC-type branched-subunit amino acid transport system substrate-binding protein